MRTFYIILFALITCEVFGQPDPCLTGSEATCRCATAPVLCTFDELNGFTYSMSLYQHPADGPMPMCPPPGGNGTTSNNPTWFGFIANCAAMTIKVSYTNCLDGPGCGGNNDFGLQAAVYNNCTLATNSVVSTGGCATAVSGCVNNSSRTLNLTSLIIGKIYYFWWTDAVVLHVIYL
ncbi:MAG: hypothetical protein IPL08_00020 [Saprospiraceae bacterium]|nr:hypothetical protein [Saprospiraceae bacterium]